MNKRYWSIVDKMLAAAGAKYKMAGMPFEHGFRAPEGIGVSPFISRGIECKIL